MDVQQSEDALKHAAPEHVIDPVIIVLEAVQQEELAKVVVDAVKATAGDPKAAELEKHLS